MNHPIMKWACMVSCLISSLAAINLGLCPFGYDFFKSDFVLINLAQFVVFMYYIVLAAGLISLACFIMCAMGGCGGCSKKSCCK